MKAVTSGINLHIVRNEVVFDSRVLRETETLNNSGLFESLWIAGFEKAGLPETANLEGRQLRRIRIRSRSLPKNLLCQSLKYAEWKHRVVHAFDHLPLTVIHCHDLEPLPIAARLKQLTGARVIYDAHELETERTNTPPLRKRIMRATEKRYMKIVDGMITVSPSIQAWYRTRYPDVPITLVRNVPSGTGEEVIPEDLKHQLEVPDTSLLFIFQGGLAFGRGVELLIEAFGDSRVTHHVVFMGDGPFTAKVKNAADTHDNIHWIPPVPPERVLAMTAGADIGLSLIEDVSLSYRYCLPNKLFEYWLAGLPVLASNLPDQANLIDQYKAGWLVEPAKEELVTLLCSMRQQDIASVRSGAAQVCREISWTSESQSLLALYRDVLQAKTGRPRPGIGNPPLKRHR